MSPVKPAYKRLETDAEYRKRCCTPWCPKLDGHDLERHVDLWHDGKQRRLVEVFP